MQEYIMLYLWTDRWYMGMQVTSTKRCPTPIICIGVNQSQALHRSSLWLTHPHMAVMPFIDLLGSFSPQATHTNSPSIHFLDKNRNFVLLNQVVVTFSIILTATSFVCNCSNPSLLNDDQIFICTSHIEVYNDVMDILLHINNAGNDGVHNCPRRGTGKSLWRK